LIIVICTMHFQPCNKNKNQTTIVKSLIQIIITCNHINSRWFPNFNLIFTHKIKAKTIEDSKELKKFYTILMFLSQWKIGMGLEIKHHVASHWNSMFNNSSQVTTYKMKPLSHVSKYISIILLFLWLPWTKLGNSISNIKKNSLSNIIIHKVFNMG